MEQQKSVKIEISGKVNYVDDITINQAAQIIAFIDNSSSAEVLPAAATRLSPVNLGATSSRGASLTPREAIDSTGAKTNPEKIVAFAKVILDEGKDTFTLEDIRPMFRRAREATPKNLSRDLDSAVRAGWVADAEVKGEYYLMTTALETLDAGFSTRKSIPGSSAPRKTRAAAASKPKTRKTVETPLVFQGLDPVPNTIEGLTPYLKLSQNRDRFLWVLKLAKDHGADGLENADIVWVTDVIGAGIPAKQLTNLFTRARAKGHVNRSTQTQRIRITPDGEAYLATLSEKA